MGTFRKISNEEKTAVMTAVQAYLDQGWTLNSAYTQVKANFQSEEKTIPAENTVRRWFAGTARTETDLTDKTDLTDSAEGKAADDAADDAEESEESQETDDYTRRLELMCRLYRTRSENACDAVCDELLPELFTEEN